MTIFKMCSVTSWSIHENMASSSMSGAGPDGSTQVEDEVSLPRAAVNKMIKEMIPNIRVSNDARELILTCCKEFIHLVSSEANDICNVQTKKTISPDHIIAALGRLGFNQYLEEIKGVHAQFKSQASNKKKSNRLENLGIPEEELLRQQEAMFAQARVEQAQEEWMQMQQTLQQQQGSMQVLPQRFDDSQAAPTHASSMLDNSSAAPKETQNVTPNSITTSVIKEPSRIQPAFANKT